MNDSPIVGLLFTGWCAHLLIDPEFHITLCDKSPRHAKIEEIEDFEEIKRRWLSISLQCKWCAKKYEKMQAVET